MKKLFLIAFLLSLCAPAFAQAIRGGGVSDSALDSLDGASGTDAGIFNRTASGNYQVGGLVKVQASNAFAPIWTFVSLGKGIANEIGQTGYETPHQTVIMMTGDSTAGMHNPAFVTALQHEYGSAGFIGSGANPLWSQAPLGLTLNSTSGTVLRHNGTDSAYDYTRSPNGMYSELSDGACDVYGTSGGYAYANKMLVLYLKEAGLGSMVVSTADFGSGPTWVVQDTIDTSNAELVGAAYTKTLSTTLSRQLQICASGGTVKYQTIGMVDTNANGVVTYTDSRGGLKLADYVSTSASVTTPWMAAIAPDMVMTKWAGNGLTQTATSCVYTDDTASVSKTFSELWTGAVAYWTADSTKRDILIDGSYPTALASDRCVQEQNDAMRAWADVNEKTYIDGYNYTKSLGNEYAMSCLSAGDEAHQTVPCQWAQAKLMLAQFGLSSLAKQADSTVREENIRTKTLSIEQNPMLGITSNNPSVGLFAQNGSDLLLTLGRDLLLTTGTVGNTFANLSSNSTTSFLPYAHIVAATNAGICIGGTGNGLGASSEQYCWQSSSLVPFYASKFYVGTAGPSNPNALVSLIAGTATVSPMHFDAGTLLSTTASGVLEYDGTALYMTATSAQRFKINTATSGSLYVDSATGLDLVVTASGTYYPLVSSAAVAMQSKHLVGMTATTGTGSGSLIIGVGAAGKYSASYTTSFAASAPSIEGFSCLAVDGTCQVDCKTTTSVSTAGKYGSTAKECLVDLVEGSVVDYRVTSNTSGVTYTAKEFNLTLKRQSP